MRGVSVRGSLPLIVVLTLAAAPAFFLAPRGAFVWVIVAVLLGWVGATTALAVIRLRRETAAPTEAVLPGGLARVSGAERREYVVPAELPPPPAALVGRDAEIDAICDYLLAKDRPGPALVVVTGAPGAAAGVGKSALAIGVAHLVADRYSGGQLLIRFGTGRVTTVDDALRMIVTALRRPDEEMPEPPERHRWYQRRSAHQRLLVILDDTNDVDKIRRLLPVGRGCAVIVTSPDTLPDLPDHLEVPVGPLDEPDGMQTLRVLVGADRVDDEPAEARRIVRASAGHLVALEMAGTALAKRKNWTLAATAHRMASYPLPRTAEDGLPPFTRVLDLAFGLLTERERTALMVLGVADRWDVTPWMLATLLREMAPDGGEADQADAARVLDRLAQLRLTERWFDDRSGTVRFRLPRYVRRYARARYLWTHRGADAGRLRTTADDALASARDRRAGHRPDLLRGRVYRDLHAGRLSAALGAAREASALSQELPSTADAAVEEGLALAALAEVQAELGWVDSGLANALAAAEGGRASPGSRSRALRVMGTLRRRQHQLPAAGAHLAEAATAVAEIDDPSEQIRILRELAVTQAVDGQPERALVTVDDAQRRCAGSGDSRARELAGVLWSRGCVLLACGRRDDAERVLADADSRANDPATGSPLWGAWIRHQRALVAYWDGRHASCRELARHALEGFTEMRHRYGAAQCRLAIGRAYLAESKVGRATSALEEAHSTLLRCGDRWLEADAAVELARAYHQPDGRGEQAVALLTAAEQAFIKLGDVDSQARAARLLWEVETVPAPARA